MLLLLVVVLLNVTFRLTYFSERFLKRVQQTAAWEEVSEETAREKASQVLLDAVNGLLDKKVGIEDNTVSIQPVPSISAPVSVDEHDTSQQLRSRRKLSQHFYSPQPDHVHSENKRRRYDDGNRTDMSASSRHSVVGCSPLRRHAEPSYPSKSIDVNDYSQSSACRSTGHVRASSSHSTVHHHAGNLDEFALLHGELLESDIDDEGSIFRGKHE
jgi:hypothetical protein